MVESYRHMYREMIDTAIAPKRLVDVGLEA